MERNETPMGGIGVPGDWAQLAAPAENGDTFALVRSEQGETIGEPSSRVGPPIRPGDSLTRVVPESPVNSRILWMTGLPIARATMSASAAGRSRLG